MSTAHKSDESALQQRYAGIEMAALRVAVAESDTPMAITDANGIIIYLNDAMRVMHKKHAEALREMIPGFHPERVLGSSMDSFHRNPAHQRTLLRDPLRLPYTGRIHSRGLSFRLVAHYVEGPQGEYLGNVLEWFDETEQTLFRQEKEALDTTLNRLMARIEFAPDGTILTANSAFLQVMGYTPEELRGKHHRIFMPKEEAQGAAYANFWAQLRAGEVQSGRIQRIARDGRTVILDADYVPVKDLEGKVFKVIKLASDITEQVRLEDLSTRLRASIDGASANLLYLDEHFQVFHLNPAMQTLLTRYGAEMREVFPELDPQAVLGAPGTWLLRGNPALREVFASPNRMPYVFEVSFGGRYYRVMISLIRGPRGQYMGNRLEFQDVTEQHLAEEQVQRLIRLAAQGELDGRIDTQAMSEGSIKTLSEGINRLMDAVAAPVHAAQVTINALAEGDLTHTMSGQYSGEFARLQESLNASMENLKQMAMEIQAAAQNITTASSEIRQGNQDLSRRTDQQASSLESTASAMEEITGTVKNNAENSARADKLANQTRAQSVEGRKIAERAIGAMVEISTASKKIADIIGVIDEIAFQTNLLALNAAVEAARAGEQGRGFAVVAAEVRNLAQRSASAAKEIKGLIKDSLEKVSDGSRLVDETGKMLDSINQSVAEVGDLIAQIATAGKEQAIGIEQINKALVKLDEMTQQNAALVEEAAAASASLDEQAHGLQSLIQFFRVEKAAGFGVRRQAGLGGHKAVRSAAPSAPHAAPKAAADDSDWDQF
ncbi:MAG: methyl-accepting chemotaxis protein [Halothiobacillaceae bacterium]